jgi:hypothetical protein
MFVDFKCQVLLSGEQLERMRWRWGDGATVRHWATPGRDAARLHAFVLTSIDVEAP